MVRVLFLGRLRDVAGASELELDDAVRSIDDLLSAITLSRPELGDALASPGIRIAVDHTIVRGNVALAASSEVAFLPPLSGG